MATRNIAKQGSYIEFTSLTETIKNVPVRQDLLGNLGLFVPEYLNTDTVVMPRLTIKDYIYKDVAWGTRAQVTQGNSKGLLTLPVPAFAVTDSITPLDIRGKYNWEDIVNVGNRPETVASMMVKKMTTAKQGWVNTHAEARMQLLRDGTAYAPNGTLATSYGSTINYYTEFGVTRQDLPLDLSDPAANPKAQIKAMIREIQNKFTGGYIPQSFMGILAPDLFDALESNDYVVDAHKQINTEQSRRIVIDRLGREGYNLDDRYEVLKFGGVTWICAAAGEMTDGEGRVFPTDVPDMFKTFFAPSIENFDVANETASDVYYYEYMSDRRDLVQLNHESNFLMATLWPAAIVRVVGTLPA